MPTLIELKDDRSETLYTRRSHDYIFKEGTRITLYDFI